MVTIRPEEPADAKSVHDLTARAFAASDLGHNGEAPLVDRLRAACPDAISRVAEIDGRVVGHILFTPAVIKSPPGDLAGMGLAPMSVDPDLQRQGIGSRLVEAGLEVVRQAGHPFVIVLGHPEFYPRFGFERASRHGVTCEFEGVPDELFRVLFFQDPPSGLSGVAKYHPEFRAA